jgi:hypothetical protein
MSNIYDYENHVENLIPSLFPNVYKEFGGTFIDFVKAYYAWLELENNPLNMARSLMSYRDVDTTPEAFLLFFKNKYLNNIQFTTATNKRLFIKNSLDFYRSKGTPRAVDLFFRLIYGVNADVYLPGEDIFKLSNAEWVKPKYLEVTHSDRNLDYLGKTVTGLGSGATAFIDRLVRRRINGKFIDIFYISAITGNFLLNETLSIDDDLTNAPVVKGSLTTAEVIDGSSGFSIGDTILLTSNNGLQGKATVTSTVNATGQVAFELVEGGWGYTVNAEVLISNSVFTLANVSVTNTTISNTFTQFEKIYQPLANITYNTLSGGTFSNGNIIEKYFANNSVAGTGTIISTTATNSTAGSLLAMVGRLSNGAVSNLNYTAAFSKQGNVVTATTGTYTDKTAAANVIAIGTNTFVVVNSVSSPFVVGESVYQSTGNGTITSFTSNSSTTTLFLTNFKGVLFSPNTVTGSVSNSTANVVSFTQSIGIVNVGNTFYTGSNAYVYGTSSNTFANVTNMANGTSANVSFTNLVYTETIYLNDDLIGANNSGLIPFLTIVLNGSNSNVASNGYGFAKTPSANINSRIFDALNYTPMNVGVIAALTNINPGNSYSLAPFVVFHEKYYKGLYKLYYTATISNISRDYTQNEVVEQIVTFANSTTLSVNNSANTWQPGEYVYQSNGTANIATGILQAQTVTANVGNLVIFSVSGAFVTNSTAVITGLTSTATANISAVNTTNYYANAKAIVQAQTNTSTLLLKRISTLDFSPTGANLVGMTSGATSTVVGVAPRDPPQSGLNANITANVTTSNGNITEVSILDSGFGYVDDEIATFTSTDNSRSGSVQLTLLNQGQSEGYFKSTKSFLSSDKKLQDGDFYQEFSYQVKSALPFEKYVDVLKKVLHLSGTKPFGAVIHDSVTNSYVNAVSYTSNIATANLFLTVAQTSNAQVFTNGEVIYQTNGTANIGFATIRTPMKTLIQINATNVNFIVGQTIQQPNASTNSAFGYVAAVTANSSVTNVYVVNSTAVFNSSANVFGPTKYVVAHLPKIKMKIATVTSGANTTQSFSVGENIYQGTIGSQTANGTVLNANLSTVEIRLNTGTFANSTTLTGQTSNCAATLTSYSNNTFTAGENVYVEKTILYLRSIVNTFSNGEIVYQYKRNPVTENIVFVNTAIGTIISKNSSSITITNSFGTFANNVTLFGSSSTANAVVNKIMSLTNNYATVVTSNTTSVTLYQISGEFSNVQTLVGLTSNTYSNISSIAVNNESFATLNVINTLEAQIVNGFFVANSTVNSIVGVTSSDTANLSAIEYIQL